METTICKKGNLFVGGGKMLYSFVAFPMVIPHILCYLIHKEKAVIDTDLNRYRNTPGAYCGNQKILLV